MTSQLFTMLHPFETEVIADIGKLLGHKATSAEIFEKIISILNDALAKGTVTRHLISYIRLAIKANPYSPQIPALRALHNKILRDIAEQRMPGLIDILRACREKALPLPLIMSCEKYMPTALALQKSFGERYHGIPPLIIRGDPSLREEHYAAPVLSLPVADSYEALPVKVFEAYLFLHALGENIGILKIDDDLKPTPGFTPHLPMVQQAFLLADYQGTPVQNIYNDRAWHFGKCRQLIPAIYGKPSKSQWARGALYFLSASALEKLTSHYMRFPGCLDGEYYEDKAVGDILFEHHIMLLQHPLEQTLGLDSSMQDRG